MSADEIYKGKMLVGILDQLKAETDLEKREQLKSSARVLVSNLWPKAYTDFDSLKPPRSIDEIEAGNKRLLAECRLMVTEMVDFIKRRLNLYDLHRF